MALAAQMPYVDPVSEHMGHWHQTVMSRWLYCHTCGLEGSHKRDRPTEWHEREFRRMHKLAAQRGYEGRHRIREHYRRSPVM